MSFVVGLFLEVPFILFFSICLDIMSQRMHAKCDTFFLKKMCQQWQIFLALVLFFLFPKY